MGGQVGGELSRPGALSIGVWVAPGATTFAVISRGASSAAQLLTIPVIAALVATYCERPAAPRGSAANRHKSSTGGHSGREMVKQGFAGLNVQLPQ